MDLRDFLILTFFININNIYVRIIEIQGPSQYPKLSGCSVKTGGQ